MEQHDRRIGLVVSGGGAKGAFAVGALQYMVGELGMSFDMAAGTSTGSLVVPMILADKLDVIVDLYSNVTTPEVVRKKFLPLALFTDALLGVEPLQRLIERNLTEEVWERLQGQRTTFVTTTNLQTGQNVFYKAGGARMIDRSLADRVRSGLSRETMVRAILASCCQPIFMPPIVVEPHVSPVEQHVDGGVRDVTPAAVLIDHGVTDLFIIDLTSIDHPPEKVVYRDLLSIFTRGLDLFTSEITKGDLDSANLRYGAVRYLRNAKDRLSRELGVDRDRIEAIFESVPDNPFDKVLIDRYTLIRPVDPLPISDPLEFDPGVMREVMAMGRERAKEVLSGRATVMAPRPIGAPAATAAP
ncbi:MAG: patatin-like phospholipase family protein [Minicystis sp.]